MRTQCFRNLKSKTMVPILNSDFAAGQLMSFCDFISLIALRRTCRQMKKCSDEALDKMAENDDVSIGKTITSVAFDVDGRYINTQLNGYWNPMISTRENMIEEALEFIVLCAEPNELELLRWAPLDQVEHTEDVVRARLLTTGTVDSNDLLDVRGRHELLEDRWRIELKQQRITLAEANQLVTNAIRKMNTNFLPFVQPKDCKEKGMRNLHHYTLCLLRIADPATVEYTETKCYWPPYASRLRILWTIKFTTRQNNCYEILHEKSEGTTRRVPTSYV